MSDTPFISFPPRYLGARSQKFSLIHNDDRMYAISKPSGIASSQHQWSKGLPDFSIAMMRELQAKKPQLLRLGIESIFRIWTLDALASGILLFAKNEETGLELRNLVGERRVTFRYHLLVESSTVVEAFHCTLPIARHFTEPRMVVSSQTGKKTETSFKKLRSYGRYQLWEAESVDFRPHQVRIHAYERGLKVIGETVYSNPKEIFLSRIKKSYLPSKNKEEKPIYEGLCVHLAQVEFTLPDSENVLINAEIPKKFDLLLRRLSENLG